MRVPCVVISLLNVGVLKLLNARLFLKGTVDLGDGELPKVLGDLFDPESDELDLAVLVAQLQTAHVAFVVHVRDNLRGVVLKEVVALVLEVHAQKVKEGLRNDPRYPQVLLY